MTVYYPVPRTEPELQQGATIVGLYLQTPAGPVTFIPSVFQGRSQFLEEVPASRVIKVPFADSVPPPPSVFQGKLQFLEEIPASQIIKVPFADPAPPPPPPLLPVMGIPRLEEERINVSLILGSVLPFTVAVLDVQKPLRAIAQPIEEPQLARIVKVPFADPVLVDPIKPLRGILQFVEEPSRPYVVKVPFADLAPDTSILFIKPIRGLPQPEEPEFESMIIFGLDPFVDITFAKPFRGPIQPIEEFARSQVIKVPFADTHMNVLFQRSLRGVKQPIESFRRSEIRLWIFPETLIQPCTFEAGVVPIYYTVAGPNVVPVETLGPGPIWIDIVPVCEVAPGPNVVPVYETNTVVPRVKVRRHV